MKQEQIFGILRAVLAYAGSYLLGKNLFGQSVDEVLWQEISGALMVLASFVWMIVSKKLTIEIFQSSILKLIMVAGALLVSSGKLTGDTLNAIVAAVTALLPVIYSILSKKKTEELAAGRINVQMLSGGDRPKNPPPNP